MDKSKSRSIQENFARHMNLSFSYINPIRHATLSKQAQVRTESTMIITELGGKQYLSCMVH
jgi:hypothetical protein